MPSVPVKGPSATSFSECVVGVGAPFGEPFFCAMRKLSRPEICRRVRKGAEGYAKAAGYTSDLMCVCAIASHALAKAFRLHGYEATLVVGEYNDSTHCWVESSDKIWDVTATQFGRPKVVIVSKKRARAYKMLPDDKQPSGRQWGRTSWGSQSPSWHKSNSILKRVKL